MAGPSYEDRVFEDYVLGEGVESIGRTVDQGDISSFAGLTLDLHPAHLDDVYATQKYGGRLAHGMLTFSLVTGLTVEYNLRAISYGYDKVRFPNPVFAGDTLRATSEVVELREHRKPAIGLVVKAYQAHKQDGSLVFVCHHTLAVERRGAQT